MALVDVDVTFDIMSFYMMRITCMLREIELMTLVELMREAAMGLTFTGNSSNEGTTLDSCEWWIS